MTIEVTREAVCPADDQLEALELTLEFGAGATLADFTGRLARTGFLHFSSTCHTLVGWSTGKPLLKISNRWGSTAVEYLAAADAKLSAVVADATIDFRFERIAPLRPARADLEGPARRGSKEGQGGHPSPPFPHPGDPTAPALDHNPPLSASPAR